MASSIVVIGSLNMDFVFAVDRLPLPGETILGRNFRTIPGGKGANQAYAAARLVGSEAEVRMLGRTGRDSFGDALKSNLAVVGVDVRPVLETDTEATGVACIHVDDAGHKTISMRSSGPSTMRDVCCCNSKSPSKLSGPRCARLVM
jgi:ribokinase